MTLIARQPAPEQPDMFGHSTAQPVRPRTPRPEFTPFPTSVAKRLNAEIRSLWPAQCLPWPEARAAEKEASFMARVAMLPPEHRGDIAERYLAEIARLKANPFRL